MGKISRGSFRETFDAGIDLADEDLKNALRTAGVPEADLRKADSNGDGVIRGARELDAAFKVLDGLDGVGTPHSFLDAGDAGTVYRGMLASKAPPAYYGERIAQAARDRVASHGRDYAFDRAPTSPLVGLSGNTDPEITRPAWLADKNKCNVWCGDVLTQAGVKAPTVKMDDGSLHYARAEKWPTRTDLFDRVTREADIRVGDVIMRDDIGDNGESTAHIEIVTGVKPMRTTGAHATGAFEEQSNWLAGATYNRYSQSWSRGTDEIYVLRPKRKLDE